MVSDLPKLASRIEQVTAPGMYEVMTWVQPQVKQLLTERERILDAIGSRT